MSATLTPADASANVGLVPGGRATKIKGQIVHVAPGAQLLDVQAVAEMLGCSPRTVYRLSDRGAMPAPVRLGALVRWKATGPGSLGEWIDQACPSVRNMKGAGR
jgi:predicted DNA-binding transcriptional regulator AlpA